MEAMEAFRFWQAFRDFKHGRSEPLARVEAAGLNALADVETSSAGRSAPGRWADKHQRAAGDLRRAFERNHIPAWRSGYL